MQRCSADVTRCDTGTCRCERAVGRQGANDFLQQVGLACASATGEEHAVASKHRTENTCLLQIELSLVEADVWLLRFWGFVILWRKNIDL